MFRRLKVAGSTQSFKSRRLVSEVLLRESCFLLQISVSSLVLPLLRGLRFDISPSSQQQIDLRSERARAHVLPPWFPLRVSPSFSNKLSLTLRTRFFSGAVYSSSYACVVCRSVESFFLKLNTPAQLAAFLPGVLQLINETAALELTG